MATTGAKNQPLVATTDTFNPQGDINTLANWVANNYASAKILTGATLHTALTGSDLFAELRVFETSTGQVWRYTGSAWVLEPLGTPPRIELTITTTSTSYFTTGVSRTVSGWTVTQNRGGFTESSGVVTVPVAGRYNVFGQFQYGIQATAAGARVWQVNLGSGVIYRNSAPAVNANTAYGTVAVTGVSVAAGETFTLTGLQTAGVSLDLAATTQIPTKFIIEYVGA